MFHSNKFFRVQTVVVLWPVVLVDVEVEVVLVDVGVEVVLVDGEIVVGDDLVRSLLSLLSPLSIDSGLVGLWVLLVVGFLKDFASDWPHTASKTTNKAKNIIDLIYRLKIW